MRLLFLITFLVTSLTLNAKDTGLEKKQITLDLKPDFNATLKHQEKSGNAAFLQMPKNQAEEKSFFNNTAPPKHKYSIGVGAFAGKAATQDGINPITINPANPKMNTIFEKSTR